MIRLTDILKESILIPRRSKEDREKNKNIAVKRAISNYVKNGCVGDLDLSGNMLEIFPPALKKIGGSLNLYKSEITSLPDDLEIKEDLKISHSKIKSLPSGLKVGGYLDTTFTDIQEIPKDLIVGYTLYASYSALKSIPDRLSVKGLWINGTEIKKLPANLKVDREFCISNTEISELPDGIYIGGNIYISDTPLEKKYENDELKQMYPGIKGKIIRNVD